MRAHFHWFQCAAANLADGATKIWHQIYASALDDHDLRWTLSSASGAHGLSRNGLSITSLNIGTVSALVSRLFVGTRRSHCYVLRLYGCFISPILCFLDLVPKSKAHYLERFIAFKASTLRLLLFTLADVTVDKNTLKNLLLINDCENCLILNSAVLVIFIFRSIEKSIVLW